MDICEDFLSVVIVSEINIPCLNIYRTKLMQVNVSSMFMVATSGSCVHTCSCVHACHVWIHEIVMCSCACYMGSCPCSCHVHVRGCGC